MAGPRARVPSPAARIGILSDDLTGANAVAARFAARGAAAFTALHATLAALPSAVQALVVDTATRDVAPEVAADAVRAAAGALHAWGVRLLAKRIDSTLRGNLGAETAALLQASGPHTLAVIVPAAPEAGRICVAGRVVVDGRPLAAAAGLPDEPLRLLARQAPGLQAAACPLPTVRRGPQAVHAALERAAAHGVRAVVCEAETEADIAVLAGAVAALGRPVLPVDPGGFTLVLADALGLVPEAAPPPADEGEGRRPENGRLLAVLGSPAAVTGLQVEVAMAQGCLVRLPVDGAALAAGGEMARLEAARALTALADGGGPAVGVDPVPREGGEPSGRLPAVADGLAQLVAEALERGPRVRGLFLTGGAVARAVLTRLGAHGVWVEREVLPLAALGRLAGGPFVGLAVVTKGGMVGGADALVRCLAALRSATRHA